MFENHHNLQGSQTGNAVPAQFISFENYYNLQGSQTTHPHSDHGDGLRTITIYRALKHHSALCDALGV